MKRIIGIGYQGRTDEQVFADLRQASVSLVIDVRANPYSRFRKTLLNRSRAESALKEHGIRYIWLGDTLGNPVDATGRRTLEGFRKHMKTWRYEQGVQRLKEVIEQDEGIVALLCLEPNDQDCHRHLIMDDVRHRMSCAPDAICLAGGSLAGEVRM